MKKSNPLIKGIVKITVISIFTGLTLVLSMLFPASGLPYLSAPLLPRILMVLPFFGLYFCFSSWHEFVNSIGISRKVSFFGEAYIFFWGFLISIILINNLWDPIFSIMQCFFLIGVLTQSNFVKIRTKPLLAVILATIIITLLISYLGFPFYTSNAQTFYYLRPFADFKVSSFFVLVFEEALLSLLFAYSLMSYIDSFAKEFLGGKTIETTSKSRFIIAHLELIPIILSPIAILQILGKTNFCNL